MALTDKLTAIGSAIRNKTGSTDLLTLDEMPTAISNIQTGGGGGSLTDFIPENAFILSGDCSYKFYGGNWDWFAEKYFDRVTTENIEDAIYMFYKYKHTTIPFDINISTDPNTYANVSNMFGNSSITTVPYIKGTIGDLENMFVNCFYLSNIPDDWADFIDFSVLHQSSHYTNSIFNSCYSLRKIPSSFLRNLYNISPVSARSPYHSTYKYCYALDEIKEIAVQNVMYTTSSSTSGTFISCSRAKGITFAIQEDRTPYTVKWKSQTLDLSQYVGYCISTDVILNYSIYNGITSEKQVTDDATYQALKDDPDWFTTDIAYSRYNHDSAVETINSLPDTSAFLAEKGGTNTIKFKGASGSATDGGAINTLTEEEIAVATAKGWTVSLV